MPDNHLENDSPEKSSEAWDKYSWPRFWTGFFKALFGHAIICLLLFPWFIHSGGFWAVLWTLPFLQLFYVIPMLVYFYKRGEKSQARGVLAVMLVTLLPIALFMLIAAVGLALCFASLVTGAHH